MKKVHLGFALQAFLFLQMGSACLAQTDTTWQDVQEMPAPGQTEAPVGRTWKTSNQGINDPNSNSSRGPRQLNGAAQGLLAPASVDGTDLPSGLGGFGFKGGGSKTYTGPYTSGGPNGNSGSSLPATATSSMLNLTILDDGGESAGGGNTNPNSSMSTGGNTFGGRQAGTSNVGGGGSGYGSSGGNSSYGSSGAAGSYGGGQGSTSMGSSGAPGSYGAQNYESKIVGTPTRVPARSAGSIDSGSFSKVGHQVPDSGF